MLRQLAIIIYLLGRFQCSRCAKNEFGSLPKSHKFGWFRWSICASVSLLLTFIHTNAFRLAPAPHPMLSSFSFFFFQHLRGMNQQLDKAILLIKQKQQAKVQYTALSIPLPFVPYHGDDNKSHKS